MSTSAVPEPAAAPPAASRVAGLIRWAVRLTSLPVLALVLASLVPALLSFSISANDDRVIAVGLCGVGLGLVLGWRWPGIGGALMLLGVGVVLAPNADWRSPDPFSIAFALQGILWFVSWVLNWPRRETPRPALRWLKPALISVLGLSALCGAAMILRGPGPTPVPKDKQNFLGVWTNGLGFALEITADGHGRVSQDSGSKSNPTNSPVAAGVSETFLVFFRSDDRLELNKGLFGASITYHIDRYPRPDGKRTRMVLNGSDPYVRGAGFVLVRAP